MAAFTRALDGVVACHESLRTSFEDIDGQGGTIDPMAEIEMRLADFSGHAADTPDALDQLLSAEYARLFSNTLSQAMPRPAPIAQQPRSKPPGRSQKPRAVPIAIEPEHRRGDHVDLHLTEIET